MKKYKFIQAFFSGMTVMFLLISLMGLIDGEQMNKPFLIVVIIVSSILLISSMIMALIFPLKTYKDAIHLGKIEEMYLRSARELDKTTQLLSDKIKDEILNAVIEEIKQNK